MTFDHFKLLTDHLTDDMIKLRKVYGYMESRGDLDNRTLEYILRETQELLSHKRPNSNNLPY